MDIHLISSLTPDDESRLAAKVLAALGGLLDGFPVSYSIRIETAVGDAIHRSHNAARRPQADASQTAPIVADTVLG